MKQNAPRRRKEDYHLRLAGNHEVYYRSDLVVKFNPLRKTKMIHKTCIVPTFNNDRKHYTHSFVIPAHGMDPDQQLSLEHERRVAEAGRELSEMLQPKPRSWYKYCGVCRGHYEDYKEHVESNTHQAHLQRSYYHNLIVHLSLRVQKEAQKAMGSEDGLNTQSQEGALVKGVSEATVDTACKATFS